MQASYRKGGSGRCFTEAVWDIFTESAALDQGVQGMEGGPTLAFQATAVWDMLTYVLAPGP